MSASATAEPSSLSSRSSPARQVATSSVVRAGLGRGAVVVKRGHSSSVNAFICQLPRRGATFGPIAGRSQRNFASRRSSAASPGRDRGRIRAALPARRGGLGRGRIEAHRVERRSDAVRRLEGRDASPGIRDLTDEPLVVDHHQPDPRAATSRSSQAGSSAAWVRIVRAVSDPSPTGRARSSGCGSRPSRDR